MKPSLAAQQTKIDKKHQEVVSAVKSSQVDVTAISGLQLDLEKVNQKMDKWQTTQDVQSSSIRELGTSFSKEIYERKKLETSHHQSMENLESKLLLVREGMKHLHTASINRQAECIFNSGS